MFKRKPFQSAPVFIDAKIIENSLEPYLIYSEKFFFYSSLQQIAYQTRKSEMFFFASFAENLNILVCR